MGHLPASKPLIGTLLLPTAVDSLVPPGHLSPQAREHWGDLVRDLGPAGLLTAVDATALAMLAEAMADYWNLRAEVQDLPDPGEMDKPEGRVALFAARVQAITASSSLDRNIRAWLGELLLTPMSRARAQPASAPREEAGIDLSALDAGERAELRKIIARRTTSVTTRVLQ